MDEQFRKLYRKYTAGMISEQQYRKACDRAGICYWCGEGAFVKCTVPIRPQPGMPDEEHGIYLSEDCAADCITCDLYACPDHQIVCPGIDGSCGDSLCGNWLYAHETTDDEHPHFCTVCDAAHHEWCLLACNSCSDEPGGTFGPEAYICSSCAKLCELCGTNYHPDCFEDHLDEDYCPGLG